MNQNQENNNKDYTSSESVPWPWVRCVQSIISTYRNTNEYYSRRDLPAELSPWLYISDEQNALDHRKLLDMGITHVLSLNGVIAYKDEWTRDKYRTHGIVHKRIRAEDREGYDMIGRHWEECFEFLESVVSDAKNKVVVHCVAGVNRSGLIACAAYMIIEGKNDSGGGGGGGVDVLDAVRHCVERRGDILSNQSFQKQLCCLAARHDLLGERPAGFSDEPMDERKVPPPPIKALDRLGEVDTLSTRANLCTII